MQSAIQKLARRHARIVEQINTGNRTDDEATALWGEAREIECTLSNTTPSTADDRAHALSVVANAMQVAGETDLARIIRLASV